MSLKMQSMALQNWFFLCCRWVSLGAPVHFRGARGVVAVFFEVYVSMR